MAFQLWQLCFIALSISWLELCIHRAIFAPLSKLPGPWYSLFTDLYLMYKEFSGQRREYIHELHKTYGPAVRLGPNEVSFTSLEALKEIYQSGGSGYDKTEFYTLFKQFGTRTMFSTLDKGNHSQKKRHIASQYANTNIMHPEVLGGIQDRANAFIRICEKSKGTGMDAYIYLHCFALDCASHHLFHPYGTKSIEGADLNMMEELSYHDSLMRNLAQYRWPTMSFWLEKVFKPRPAPLANDYVLASSRTSDSGEHSLTYKLQNSKDAFQPIQIAAECMDHMAAGIDTTGDALCLLMYQLSLSESFQVQDQLITELSINKDKAFDDLPYLDAVIKEGLRCFPPIPMSQPRYAPTGGRTIDGYFIPGHTIVSCQAWSVHQLNEDVFIKGDQFLPERWLDPKAALEMNRLFFSFGAGGRGCTGRHLAIAEMKCLLREVYIRYKTRVAPEMRGRMNLSDQVISSRPLDQTCKLIFEPLN
ncbi:cytochrome P450 monooxygenase [Mollisia scopiformis]|uniref:Cytochrome P450 monooxygenase n=1 Tax=Mollisia scopiformis TaxID=149040 RepID=A0A194XNY3_MOLSC|nr:cytochrome P450 monooxygenase [Mollisia scopiformis]KUJ21876.1 cytochrome P450 monooxygenase [Mollisia scopiformis]